MLYKRREVYEANNHQPLSKEESTFFSDSCPLGIRMLPNFREENWKFIPKECRIIYRDIKDLDLKAYIDHKRKKIAFFACLKEMCKASGKKSKISILPPM